MVNNKKKVFLSYAYKDNYMVNKIIDRLLKNNIEISNIASNTNSEEELSSELVNSISSSDYIVIFISPNYSKWQEYETYIGLDKYLSRRDITIIPVLLDKVVVPDILNTFLYIDLTENIDIGLNVLINQIQNTSKIDFSMLNGYQLENLVADLLQEIGFINIKRNITSGDANIDIICDYKYADPFGSIQLETWIVEVKLYSNSRLDISSIQQIKSQLLSNINYNKALIVTNGYLTSASKQALDLIKSKEQIDIRVMEGSELKRLLLNNNTLINKYFVLRGE